VSCQTGARSAASAVACRGFRSFTFRQSVRSASAVSVDSRAVTYSRERFSYYSHDTIILSKKQRTYI
jgi:hypothetical protein